MAGTFAFGTSLSITIESTLTPVASLTSISGPDQSADEIDLTAHDSANGFREFAQGLKDAGSVEIEGNFTGVASQTALQSLFDSGVANAMEITYPSSLGKYGFSGFLTAFSMDAPHDDKLSFSASIKITGKPVFTGA